MIRDRPLDARAGAARRDHRRASRGGRAARPTVSRSSRASTACRASWAIAVQLRQVFVNLVENAVQAGRRDGEVRVTASARRRRVAIAVEDTGPGVDAGTRRRLFEPLITTKAKGIGLGLALVKRIVERHGGSDRATSRAGRGARFVVRLPRRRPADAYATCIVDDNQAFAENLAEILRDEGAEVDVALGRRRGARARRGDALRRDRHRHAHAR